MSNVYPGAGMAVGAFLRGREISIPTTHRSQGQLISESSSALSPGKATPLLPPPAPHFHTHIHPAPAKVKVFS